MSNYKKLVEIINEIDKLIEKKVTNSDASFAAWKTKAERFLIHNYGNESHEFKKFSDIKFNYFSFTLDSTHNDWVNACKDGLIKAKAILNTYLEDFNEESESFSKNLSNERETFNDIIMKDIDKCTTILENDIDRSNLSSYRDLFSELYGKYSKSSQNFPNVETNSLALNNNISIYRVNIIKIKGFLTAYVANGCEDFGVSEPQKTSGGVNVNVYNSNEVNISNVVEVKKEIENMSGLTEEEIEEINSKIDALEEIIKSGDRKSKKWSNAKEIVKWMADKSVDVALTLIPLLMKIQ